MPWGWECRAKLIKQVPAKPTEKRKPVSAGVQGPAPNHYEIPQIFCGKGFSNVKRAPAYTFGHLTVMRTKPITTPYAPMFNTQGLGRKGQHRITHSVVGPLRDPPGGKLKVPGPGAYTPNARLRYKRPPAYSVRPAARPPYEPWDQWTPPPNMYCPPHIGKKAPAYTFGCMVKPLQPQELPGPGQHDPKFEYVDKNKPAFSFGGPFKPLKPQDTPSPNTYCEKKFIYPKRTIPAPSFGIRHSPYLGKQEEFMKPSKLELNIIKS
ncbi:uncharacterized protein [Epargyreus clarus]|uniref:uncharacterized protein n=1 Tax=Epargyreus clarus TaxID=520877 RepID=UPI003C2AE0F8